MKSTELMVGDWVIDRREIEPLSRAVRPTRITSISHDGELKVSNSVNVYEVWSNVRYLKPIPLTAEILKINGWTPTQPVNAIIYRLFIGDIIIEVFKHDFKKCEGEGDWFVGVMNKNASIAIPFYYVHELQHALRLCGIDKDIEL